MFLLVDIYIDRPYLFAGTRFHMIRKGTYRVWSHGAGRFILAEYALAQQVSGRALVGSPFFRWDRVVLQCREDKGFYNGPTQCTHYFELEDSQFKYMAEIYFGYETLMVYHLEKCDIVNNITICATFDSDVYVRDTHEFVDWVSSAYSLRVKRGHQNDDTETFMSRHNSSSSVVCKRDIIPPFTQVSIINHNIFDIFEFMKTSRLDMVDHLPRYIIEEMTSAPI
jgi:hypothetical protein